MHESSTLRPRRKRRRVTVIGLCVGLFVGAAAIGVSVAQWTLGGSGTVKSKSTSVTNLSLAGVTPTGDLFPGSVGAVSFTVHNPNPFPVTVTGISFGTISNDNASCATSNLTTTDKTGLSIAVAANATSSTQSVAGAAGLLLAAPDACQGVTWTVNATVTATQS